ncbi:MAG: FtsK/SpoIIIE domain-containing protein [Acidimicrobiales bacterium]
MRILHVSPRGSAVELDVRAGPGATVADLTAALAPDRSASTGLVVDDRPVDPDETITHTVADGAVVAVVGGAEGGHPVPAARPVVMLEVVGGLDAGRRLPLRPGPVVIGRGEGCDVVVADATVSRVHATLTVAAGGPGDRDPDEPATVVDTGSTNGTWVGAAIDAGAPVRGPTAVGAGVVLRLGAAQVVVRTLDARADCPSPRPGPDGTVAVNRPPRGPAPPAPPPVAVPEPPPPPPPPTPVQLVAVLAPLGLAAVMVVALGNMMFAAFALLGPVMAVGGAVEGRRRSRRARRAGAARLAADVVTFRAELAGAAAIARDRLEAMAPDPAAVVARVAAASPRLWERRPADHDWLVLRAGTGPAPCPPVLEGDRGPRPAPVAAAVDDASVLAGAPVVVELGDGGVLGVVGARPAALAVARSLVVQAAVHHGPADLEVLVACAPGRGVAWEWARWLPHARDLGGTGSRVAAGPTAVAMAEAALASSSRPPSGGGRGAPPPLSDHSTRATMVVVDGDALLEGRPAPVRALLRGEAGPVAGVVVAERADRLPRSCTAVLVLDGADGLAELVDVASGRRIPCVLVAGLAETTAREAARGLARYDDPELGGGGTLPAEVLLPPLLGLDVGGTDGAGDDPLSAAVADRWAAAGPDPRPVAPLGVGADGPVDVDLAAHGPHALVAGTTGAGKSELLRTLVVGLAASADPDHLTVVLVDFKGGGAFDACARLPHVVGLVTDLDEGLAERALRCLDAELRHRERMLRGAGVDDLAGYRRARAASPPGPVLDPMPRLVVVVDEFATLKAEVPGFVDNLVGLAQRGRSLGVHLVLATQRPAGAVSEQIRTNTGLRIALRVEDARDSTDVIDDPAAAALPRSRPGRACVRFEVGHVVTIQTALATGRCAATGRDAPVVLVPVGPVPGDGGPAGGVAHRGVAGATAGDEGPTDLDRLVDACVATWAATGRPPPRRPWPDPLPPVVSFREVVAAPGADEDGLVAVALADDPDRQCQPAAGWYPGRGPLLAVGASGSGPSAALAAVALALAAAEAPDRLHLYVLDHGAGALAVLGGLPHCGAVAGAGEPERQARTVRLLRAELDRRRALAPGARAAQPRVVLLIDGLGGFVADHDGLDGIELLDALTRVALDGAEVGLHVAAAADRPGAARAALGGSPAQRWAFALAEPTDAALLGLRAGFGAGGRRPPEGRGTDAGSGLELQVAMPPDGVAAAVAALATGWGAPPAPREGGPVPIGVLPVAVDVAAVTAAVGPVPAPAPHEPLVLAVGVLDRTLGPAPLVLHDGGGAVIAGPPRSGRSTLLAAVVLAAQAVPGVEVVVVAPRRSPLAALLGPAAAVGDATDAGAVAAALDVLAAGGAGPGRRAVLVVDDADAVDDPDGRLAALAASPPPGVSLVVAARTDALRGAFGHWTRAVRRSRVGVLLRPDLSLDGELLGVVLPRRVATPARPGLGFVVVDGVAELAQLAHP